MKVEILKDGTGMAYVAYCEGLYENGRNILSGPSAKREDVIQGAFNELIRMIQELKQDSFCPKCDTGGGPCYCKGSSYNP
jgi:hypothetical protein